MWHFARLLGFGAFVAAVLAMGGADEVFAQKKDKKAEPKGTSATPADYVLMQKNKEVFGTILSVGGAGKTIALRVDTPHMEPNPDFKPPTVTNPKAAGYNQQANQQYQQMREYQEIKKQMQQAANAKNPQEQRKLMQRLQMDMARLQQDQQKQFVQQKGAKAPGKGNADNTPFRLVHHLKDYEFDLQEGAVLRKMYLPTEFDDTGNIKEYTEKVKAELRGTDKTKPGYLAKLDEVAPGAEAKLSLVAPKAAQKAAKVAKATDDDDGVGNVERSSVKMVVLTKVSPNSSMPSGAPKKKDKK